MEPCDGMAFLITYFLNLKNRKSEIKIFDN